MSGWLHQTTRWAIYARDGFQCAYCRVTIHQLLEDYGDNFLTVDHLVTGSLGGGNEPANLVTCCYDCNCSKGVSTLKDWCRDMGWVYTTVLNYTWRRRKRDLEPYREAAKVLLGLVPGVPIANLVVSHDWMVKKQWQDSVEAQYWECLMHLETGECSHCGAPIGEDGRHTPPPEPDPDKWWNGDGPPPF